MESLYSETYLHAKAPKKTKMIRGGLIALAIFLILLGVLFSLALGTFLVLGVMILIAVIIFYFMPTDQIAYEYIFVDGQIDFDCIYKGEKRKTLKRIDMAKVEVIAPVDSDALISYGKLPVFDFSSGMTTHQHFIAVNLGEKGLEKIIFTPDDKMKEMMYKKSPSKFKEK